MLVGQNLIDLIIFILHIYKFTSPIKHSNIYKIEICQWEETSPN